VIVALGGGGGIVLGLSNWLGKVWAERLMQKEKATYERELEDFKRQSLRSLEQEKALYQKELEDFKSQLSRDSDRTAQTLREKLSLYKEAVPPIVDLVIRSELDPAAVTPLLLGEFERKRIATSAMLGMFAAVPVFDAYNELIDYLFDCLEKKRNFLFPNFRLLSFKLMSEIRKDVGLSEGELVYRGPR
jgi:inorganic triphosphatase YgiF